MTLKPFVSDSAETDGCPETGTERNKRHRSVSVRHTQTNQMPHHTQWAADH
ncbi:MAG: hypothetical protein PUJ30_00490 [Bacteroidales bacterium]|nr:hypothetical protein [Bacteroidales bacterium]MDY4620713.1 hypothetical protein [Alloprevotella sp.]